MPQGACPSMVICGNRCMKCGGYRVVGELPKTNFLMNLVLWIGVFPVLTREMLGINVKTESDVVLTAKGEFMVI